LVIAAGAGPGTGEERKRTVDLGGAVKLVEAAQALGIRRYVMVSSIGADDPRRADEKMRPYLEAKAEADAALEAAGLDHTIVRPGMLTDDPGRGTVSAGPDLGRDEVARDDVAAVLAAALVADNTIGKTFVVVRGETPVEEAVAAI
ncbi:MAG: NAD(P)H-binding protein, partial [Actinomycetota bacterium]|nr:NAD(P)H-binding protein [Actinomycetota bacterium]